MDEAVIPAQLEHQLIVYLQRANDEVNVNRDLDSLLRSLTTLNEMSDTEVLQVLHSVLIKKT